MLTLFTNLLRLIQTKRLVVHSCSILFALAVGSARADMVNLTSGPPFNFQSGTDLYVQFSVWNYAANNIGSSPYPTSVGLQLLGSQPAPLTLQSLPNSSSAYYSGYLLQGWLENTDGTVSAPFESPAAARLGLASGSLLLGPGIFGGDSTPIAVIEADAVLSLNLSEQIFGIDIASRGSSAMIHLRNLGSDLQIGLSGGYSLLSAISEPGISGVGPVTTSGITQAIQVTAVPEPGSFLLFAGTAALFIAFGSVLYLKRSYPKHAIEHTLAMPHPQRPE